jgi:hypothetical protein
VKFRISETIKLKTSKGKLELKPGQVVALPHDAAVKLLNDNKITPIGKAIYKVYSKILDDFLWIVANEKELRNLIAEGVQDAIYIHHDIEQLDGISKEGLKAIHKIKRVFPGSTVEDIKHKNKD